MTDLPLQSQTNKALLREAISVVLEHFGVNRPGLVEALANVSVAWASLMMTEKTISL